MRGVIVAGIGTDVGKTVASAVLCEALGADYWKPVASGAEAGPTDDAVMVGLLRDGGSRVHPCTYLFKRPLSPHAAAALEGGGISIDRFQLPEAKRPIVVELAGGVLVPLSDEHTNMELIRRLDLPVVVVSQHYLGSINHTLLTLDALRSHGASVMGIIFNGEELPDTERIILRMGAVRVLGRLPRLVTVDSAAISALAEDLRLSA